MKNQSEIGSDEVKSNQDDKEKRRALEEEINRAEQAYQDNWRAEREDRRDGVGIRRSGRFFDSDSVFI